MASRREEAIQAWKEDLDLFSDRERLARSKAQAIAEDDGDYHDCPDPDTTPINGGFFRTGRYVGDDM